jgi:hypothetical protein
MQNVLVRLVQLPQNVKSIVLFGYLAKSEPTPPDFEPTFTALSQHCIQTIERIQ